jgi:hypothetical protein
MLTNGPSNYPSYLNSPSKYLCWFSSWLSLYNSSLFLLKGKKKKRLWRLVDWVIFYAYMWVCHLMFLGIFEILNALIKNLKHSKTSVVPGMAWNVIFCSVIKSWVLCSSFYIGHIVILGKSLKDHEICISLFSIWNSIFTKKRIITEKGPPLLGKKFWTRSAAWFANFAGC